MTAPLSSLPAWHHDATVDPSARSLALIGVGTAAADLVRSWARGADRPTWTATAETLNPELLADFDAELARATVGWRLMIAGDESSLGLLRARALAAGAEPCEVRSVLTGPALVSVYCVHCARVFSPASAGIGSGVACPHCRRWLGVRPHYSAELGAYLAVAEQPDEPA